VTCNAVEPDACRPISKRKCCHESAGTARALASFVVEAFEPGFPKTLQLSTIYIKNRAAGLHSEFSSARCSPWISAFAAFTATRPSSPGLNRTKYVLSVIFRAYFQPIRMEADLAISKTTSPHTVFNRHLKDAKSY
jgi:hypothetical protein